MKRYSQGFSLAIVLLMSSMLCTLSLLCWYKISLVIDSICKKEQAARLYEHAEYICSYGLKVALLYFEDIYSEINIYKKPVVWDMNDLIRALGVSYNSVFLLFDQVVYDNTKRGLFLKTIIQQGDYKSSVQCVLIKSNEKSLLGQGVSFAIECYSFSSSY